MKKQIIKKPWSGWKDQTWYLVEVSYSTNNPIHRDLFYTGFLSKEGKPSGYNYLTCQGDSVDISKVYYLKPIRVVCSKRDFHKMPTINKFFPPSYSEKEESKCK